MNTQHLGLKLLVGFLGFLIIVGVTLLLYGVISGKKPFFLGNGTPTTTMPVNAVPLQNTPVTSAPFMVEYGTNGQKIETISVQPNFIAITSRGEKEQNIQIINPLNGALLGRLVVKP